VSTAPRPPDPPEPPEVTATEQEAALREVAEREPGPDDLVIDPPEAVAPEERGQP
jgi:hypothetical protein